MDPISFRFVKGKWSLGLVNDEEKLLNDISISVLHLSNLEKKFPVIENGSMQKDRVRSLKNGLEFLGKLYFLSLDVNLGTRVKQLAADVKHVLAGCEEDNGVLDMMKDNAYETLQKMMMNLAYSDNKFCPTFQDAQHSMCNYMRIIDLLLQYISEVLSTNSIATVDDQIGALVKMVGELKKALTYHKPLYVFIAHQSNLNNGLTHIPLNNALNKAVVAVYLLLIGKMDEVNLVFSLQSTLRCFKRCRNLNIYVRFLKFGSSELTYDKIGQFYILDNLIHMLSTNSDSLNDANKYLYKELRELRTYVANQSISERLNHYFGLTASIEAICLQAVPILYSCYMEIVETEEDMHRERNQIIIYVIGKIKMIKRDLGSQEMYGYPGVDGLGFLEFFLGYLKELEGHEHITAIRSDIDSLHINIHCLVFSLKTSQEKFSREGLFGNIVRLVYQAEYMLDLYLAIHDSRFISTLSNIVEEVIESKEKLLVLLDKSIPVENVVLSTCSPFHGMSMEVNKLFIGFKEEIGAVMKYLLGGENDLQVISLVGMAGSGKTSLAKHLFNESLVGGNFDKKAWCTVSQSYQTRDLFLTILKQINPIESDTRMTDDQELADELCRILKRRRYLLVIDDVWDVSIWNYFRRYFPDDKNHSRILITTRDYNVALETKSKIHDLRALTEAESWELLQKKLSQQESLPKNIVSIAKNVLKSCNGLPLSIVILGGLMHNVERNLEMWNQIAKHVTSTILFDPQGKCEEILELSYNHLPSHLKSCFLYLGVFPEDHKISVNRLVRLWVAEGLVRGITSEECLEDVGKRYVDDLITRSLVIPIKEKTEGGVKIFQLHDLLRDFCLKKAKDERFFTVLNDRGSFDLSVCTRRIGIHHGMNKHLPFICLNSVRTILSFCESNLLHNEIELIMESDHMMLLNVLDIHELIDIASYLHRFVHLRYLAIWSIFRSDQVLVQSSISKLWNLQTLILSFYNTKVYEVPEFIWDLVKLRHLHLLPTALFSLNDSKRIEEAHALLENLKSLSKPRLHYGDSIWLRKLPGLQKLSCIFFYSRDNIRFQQYQFPELNLCNRLTSLKIENRAKGNRRRGKLHLPESLRKLSLSEFILDSDDISEIGTCLPNLVVLKLHDSIENWSVNNEDFLKLKVLKITGRKLHEWDSSEDPFPNLEQLWLESCHSLNRIPISFGDIPGMRLISIKYCNPDVYESAREIQKIQVGALNLELKVILQRTVLHH